MPYNDPNPPLDETSHLLTQLTRIGVGINKEFSLISEKLITRRVQPENFRQAQQRTPDVIRVIVQFSKIRRHIGPSPQTITHGTE